MKGASNKEKKVSILAFEDSEGENDETSPPKVEETVEQTKNPENNLEEYQQQVNLVNSTWLKIISKNTGNNTFGSTFLENLSKILPDAQKTAKTPSQEAHKSKTSLAETLETMIATIVLHAKDPLSLEHSCPITILKHCYFNVNGETSVLFRSSLLTSLEQLLTDEWSRELEVAWENVWERMTFSFLHNVSTYSCHLKHIISDWSRVLLLLDMDLGLLEQILQDRVLQYAKKTNCVQLSEKTVPNVLKMVFYGIELLFDCERLSPPSTLYDVSLSRFFAGQTPLVLDSGVIGVLENAFTSVFHSRRLERAVENKKKSVPIPVGQVMGGERRGEERRGDGGRRLSESGRLGSSSGGRVLANSTSAGRISTGGEEQHRLKQQAAALVSIFNYNIYGKKIGEREKGEEKVGQERRSAWAFFFSLLKKEREKMWTKKKELYVLKGWLIIEDSVSILQERLLQSSRDDQFIDVFTTHASHEGSSSDGTDAARLEDLPGLQNRRRAMLEAHGMSEDDALLIHQIFEGQRDEETRRDEKSGQKKGEKREESEEKDYLVFDGVQSNIKENIQFAAAMDTRDKHYGRDATFFEDIYIKKNHFSRLAEDKEEGSSCITPEIFHRYLEKVYTDVAVSDVNTRSIAPSDIDDTFSPCQQARKVKIKKDVASLVGKLFYTLMLQQAPTLRKIFSLAESVYQVIFQRLILMLLSHSKQPENMWMEHPVLGLKHITFGVRTNDIPLFNHCMYEVLKMLGGPRWTPSIDNAWKNFLTLATHSLHQIVLSGSNPICRALIRSSIQDLQLSLRHLNKSDKIPSICELPIRNQIYSPILWCLHNGDTTLAAMLLRDLLTIRIDRERTHYGYDALWKTHPQFLTTLCEYAPSLLHVLFDGSYWVSDEITQGQKKMIFWIPHLYGVVDKESFAILRAANRRAYYLTSGMHFSPSETSYCTLFDSFFLSETRSLERETQEKNNRATSILRRANKQVRDCIPISYLMKLHGDLRYNTRVVLKDENQRKLLLGEIVKKKRYSDSASPFAAEDCIDMCQRSQLQPFQPVANSPLAIILQHLSTKSDMYFHPVLQFLVEKKWEMFGRTYFIFHVLFNLVVSVVFCTGAYFFGREEYSISLPMRVIVYIATLLLYLWQLFQFIRNWMDYRHANASELGKDTGKQPRKSGTQDKGKHVAEEEGMRITSAKEPELNKTTGDKSKKSRVSANEENASHEDRRKKTKVKVSSTSSPFSLDQLRNQKGHSLFSHLPCHPFEAASYLLVVAMLFLEIGLGTLSADVTVSNGTLTAVSILHGIAGLCLWAITFDHLLLIDVKSAVLVYGPLLLKELLFIVSVFAGGVLIGGVLYMILSNNFSADFYGKAAYLIWRVAVRSNIAMEQPRMMHTLLFVLVGVSLRLFLFISIAGYIIRRIQTRHENVKIWRVRQKIKEVLKYEKLMGRNKRVKHFLRLHLSDHFIHYINKDIVAPIYSLEKKLDHSQMNLEYLLEWRIRSLSSSSQRKLLLALALARMSLTVDGEKRLHSYANKSSSMFPDSDSEDDDNPQTIQCDFNTGIFDTSVFESNEKTTENNDNTQAEELDNMVYKQMNLLVSAANRMMRTSLVGIKQDSGPSGTYGSTTNNSVTTSGNESRGNFMSMVLY